LLTEPLSVTYDGSAKSLPRVSGGSNGTKYRTGDGEFEVSISDGPKRRDGSIERVVSLSRVLPDPTPADVFDNYRFIRNTFSVSYSFDSTRAETSVDIPKLRTALLAWLDSTTQSRIISGEK